MMTPFCSTSRDRNSTSRCRPTARTCQLVTSLGAGLMAMTFAAIAVSSTRWIDLDAAPAGDATWRVRLLHVDDDLNTSNAQLGVDEIPAGSLSATRKGRGRQQVDIEVCVTDEATKMIDQTDGLLPEIYDRGCVELESIEDVHCGLWTLCAVHRLNTHCDLSRCADVCDAGIDVDDVKLRLVRHLATRSPTANTLAAISDQVSTPVAVSVIGGAMTSSVAILIGLSIFYRHCDLVAIAAALLHAVAGLLQLVGLFLYVATVSDLLGTLNNDDRPYQYGSGVACLVAGFLASNVAACSTGYAVSTAHRSQKQRILL